MIVYNYKAKKSPTEVVTGEIEADTPSGAIAKLTQMGLFPIEVKEAGAGQLVDKANLRISANALIFFTREVADLLNSGVNLINALSLISEQTNHKKLQYITSKIEEKVKEGATFSDALSQFSGIFSPLYINVVKSGEVAGNTDKVMLRLSTFYERNMYLRSKIMEALAYPMFLVLMGFASVMVLTLFVIPKLIPMFEDMGTTLPLITRVVIKVSDSVITYWYLGIIACILFFFLYINIMKSKALVIKLQFIFLKIPLVKDFVSTRYFSEIFQSLESLVSNGIPTIKAIDITRDSCGFYPYKEVLRQISVDIANGDSFSKSLKNCTLFPQKIQTIIKVGEESGHLEMAMRKLADGYTTSFEKASSIMTKFAGPFFIIIIAGFIGMVVIAMLLPILNLNVAF